MTLDELIARLQLIRTDHGNVVSISVMEEFLDKEGKTTQYSSWVTDIAVCCDSRGDASKVTIIGQEFE